MKSRIRTGLLAVALVMGLAAVLVQGAAAQAGPLPAYTPFPSADFTLTGQITAGPQTIAIAGTGMQGGDQFQQQLNFTLPQGTLTYDMIQVGTMFYFRTNADPQWRSIDLSTQPGGVPNIQSNVPGLNGFTPNGGQRTYAAVTASQQVGKETIEGAATTKYESTVDVAKLYNSIGSSPEQAAQVAAVSKMTLYLWIGDADQYIHQQQVVLNTKAFGPGGAMLDVVVNFTITYRNFGKTLAITAPEGAVPYVPAAQASPTATPAPNLGLPEIKTPSSSRFDMRGSLAAGTDSINFSGSGGQSGTSTQFDMTLTAPGESEAITLHVIQTSQRLYVRLDDDPQWQYMDVSQGMSGMAGMMPGVPPGLGLVPGLMPGLSPADLELLLQDAVKVQQVGKEAVGGAPTTKYQVDLDLAKLVGGASPGTPLDPETQQILASAKFMLLLWVGDSDQYLHQFQMVLNLQAPDENNEPQTVSLDLTYSFHDFDTPITITEPANAVPVDLGGTPPVVSQPIATPPPVVSQPIATPPPVVSQPIATPPPVIAPPPNPAPGMPTTGAAPSFPLPLLLALGLGLFSLAVGLRLRKAVAKT